MFKVCCNNICLIFYHALGWCYIPWPVVADAVVQSLAWWVSDGTEDSVRHSWADWVFPQQAVLPSSSASAADAPLPTKHAVCLYTHIQINILMTRAHAMTSARTPHESEYNKLHVIFIHMHSNWMTHMMTKNNIVLRLHTYPSFFYCLSIELPLSFWHLQKQKQINVRTIRRNGNQTLEHSRYKSTKKQICHFLILLKRDLGGLQHLNHELAHCTPDSPYLWRLAGSESDAIWHRSRLSLQPMIGFMNCNCSLHISLIALITPAVICYSCWCNLGWSLAPLREVLAVGTRSSCTARALVFALRCSGNALTGEA